MRKVKVSAVRGNAAEIANTLGEDWLIKGVDAGEESGDRTELAKSREIMGYSSHHNRC